MKVIVIDDDRLVSASLKTILEADPEIEVVALGNSGAEAIVLYDEHNPDILLMDIRMDGMTGLEAGEQILAKDRGARVLYLTTFLDDEYIIKALKIGAKGYLLKQAFESIVPALKAVYSGQSVFGDEIVTKIPMLLGGETAVDFSAYGISERDLEIIEGVAQGLSNREISETLFLSEGTVRNYISNILDKLELRDRTQLAIFYFNHK
ncbi:response regulator transcription factor [Eubacterium sp. 1001713B170207_170306_E7]|uniref:response regulator n=1 Tax=Eubacterium sp. 1001713B170207_170306_E7 TaxID=2787097 RepID=UPI00189B72E3|nr:response regulator transcription factor [Eubacterium sp. 1001713B170207_170306_E7]